MVVKNVSEIAPTLHLIPIEVRTTYACKHHHRYQNIGIGNSIPFQKKIKWSCTYVSLIVNWASSYFLPCQLFINIILTCRQFLHIDKFRFCFSKCTDRPITYNTWMLQINKLYCILQVTCTFQEKIHTGHICILQTNGCVIIHTVFENWKKVGFW